MGCCILFIAEEADCLKDLLTLYGYEVEQVTREEEAHQRLSNEKALYQMVLLDVTLPTLDGWKLLSWLRSESCCPKIPVILFVSEPEEEHDTTRGLRMGADAVLTKPVSASRLLAKIEALLRLVGRLRESGSTARFDEKGVKEVLSVLTDREVEVLRYIARGYSNSRIADTLVLSETTVKNHLASIYKKLNVSNRTQAAYMGYWLQNDR